MVITYHGLEFFKVQFGDMVVAFNPISKESKHKSSRFGADLCLVTVNHNDFNGVENVFFGEKEPFVIDGPGEYEIKGVFVKGLESHSSYDGGDRINTIYLITLDAINICFLGALDLKELSRETIEALGEVDVLFVPIGGDGVLKAQDAYKLAVSLEPKLIIPMHHEDDKEALKMFLKEGGSSPSPVEKLTIKRKDIEGKEGEIIILQNS